MSKSIEVKEWLRHDSFQQLLFYCYCVWSLGIIPIICFYHPTFYATIRLVPCKPVDATYVIFTDVAGEDQVCRVEHLILAPNGSQDLECHLMVVEIDCVRYCAYSGSQVKFLRVKDVPEDFKRHLLVEYSSDDAEKILLALYGINAMTIPETSFSTICIRYLLSPLYLFQYFSAAVWCCENYVAYAIVILLITFLAVYVTARETFSNLESLRSLAGVHEPVQRVARDEEGQEVLETINDIELVPGQRIVIAQHMTLPCDLVLLCGRVVVDEAMLTGESIPVTKVPIDVAQVADVLGMDDEDVLSAVSINLETEPADTTDSDKATATAAAHQVPFVAADIAIHRPGSVLFSGTKVMAVYGDNRCEAVVYRTAFRSAKGRLIASLLKPKNEFISFISDALWVLLAMVILATVLYIISSIVLLTYSGYSYGEVLFFYLDMLTIAVPPALVASLSIATATSVSRLRKKQIFVSDTSRVNYAGVVSAVCFDKTGTLTDDQLSFVGVLSPQIVQVGSSVSLAFHEIRVDDEHEHTVRLPLPLSQLMATCHNLSLFTLGSNSGSSSNSSNSNSSAAGDPLEVELLRASGWSLAHSNQAQGQGQLVAWQSNLIEGEGRSETVILKHFEFTPDRLRAASIVHITANDAPERYLYLAKGSPEAILQLCNPQSVPDNTQEQLLRLARTGLRVIAMARRILPSHLALSDITQLTQEQCENEQLTFLGLLFLSNKLKEDSMITIDQLQAAKLHVNMITGDHVYTAIHKAAEVGILRHYHPQSTVNDSAQDVNGSGSSGTVLIIDYNTALDSITITDASSSDSSNGSGSGSGDSVIIEEAIYNAAYSYLQDLLPLVIDDAVIDHTPTTHNTNTTPSLTNSSSAVDERAMLLTKIDHSVIRPKATAQRKKVELAVTGAGLLAVQRLYPRAVLISLVRYAKVFARAKPADKKLIVEMLMKAREFEDLRHLSHWHNTVSSPLFNDSNVSNVNEAYDDDDNDGSSSSSSSSSGSINDREARDTLQSKIDVLFCGDGANDMIALRAATVGISLCDAETSVAAPITSKIPTPFSVIEVLKEGRSSLVTAYTLVTFNILYAGIQTLFTNSVYFFGYNAGEYMFLEQDLGFSLALGIAMTHTKPAEDLSIITPPKRFLKFYLVFRLVVSLLVFAVFQALVMVMLTQQSFYVYVDGDGGSYGYQTSSAQEICLAQILIASIVSSIGPPYQQRWYENKMQLAIMAAQVVFLLFQTFAQDNWFLIHVFKVEPLPVEYGLKLAALMIANLVVSLAVVHFTDHWFLRSTNRRWFDIVKISQLCQPSEAKTEEKMKVEDML